MTTLDNGVIIDERFTAVYSTPENMVENVFGIPRGTSRTCLHHWGNLGQKFDDVVNYLASRNDRKVSAHFVVEDGRVTCLVSPGDASWAAGDAEGNATCIHIECRPEMTQGDIDTLASLIRKLEQIYGDQSIYFHNNFVKTECPGKYRGALDQIISKINGGAGSNSGNVVNDGPVVKCGCN